MDEEFEKIIEERCDLALQKNKEYIDLQIELANAHENGDIDAFSEVSFRMQNIAMKVSYKSAIRDLHNVITE